MALADRRVATLIAFPGLILLGFLAERWVLSPSVEARLPDEEVAYWEQHVERNRSAASRVRLGLAYERVDRLEDAQRAYESALEEDPHSEPAAIGRYGILRRRDQRERATADLEAYARDHPSCAICWHNLVAAYLEQDRIDDAEAALEALFDSGLTVSSGMYSATNLHFEAYLIAGRVYAARGDHERAVGLFRDAIERDPRDPRAHLHAARSLLAGGQPGAASEALDEAEARLAPEQTWMRREVARLRRQAERRSP